MPDRNTFYDLWHFKLGPDLDPEAPQADTDDERQDFHRIGVYSTRERAEIAVQYLRSKPGFRHWPDGFRIYESWLGCTGWEGGFVGFYDEPDWPRPPPELPRSAVLQFIGRFLDHDALRILIAAQPAKAWRKGDPTHRFEEPTAYCHKTSGCEYHSDNLTRSPDLDEHVATLLSLASPTNDALHALLQRNALRCSVVCCFESRTDAAAWQPSPANAALSTRLRIPVRKGDIF